MSLRVVASKLAVIEEFYGHVEEGFTWRSGVLWDNDFYTLWYITAVFVYVFGWVRGRAVLRIRNSVRFSIFELLTATLRFSHIVSTMFRDYSSAGFWHLFP